MDKRDEVIKRSFGGPGSVSVDKLREAIPELRPIDEDRIREIVREELAVLAAKNLSDDA